MDAAAAAIENTAPKAVPPPPDTARAEGHAEATASPAVEAPAAPAADDSTEPEPPANDTPFGALKRRTTNAWKGLPRPAVPTDLPPFPSIASELPSQETARETFGTLKRRTTETWGSLQRRTTLMRKNVSVPSMPDKRPPLPPVAGPVPSERPKWADFARLASQLPKMPWPQGPPADQPLPATWERVLVPSLPRSSHTINVVGGNAYLFGGEVEPRKPVDNDMHLLVLPHSSASADYLAIKAKAAPRPAPVPIPRVVEPLAQDAEGKGKETDLRDVDLASPPEEGQALGTGAEHTADGPAPATATSHEAAHAGPDDSALGHVPSARVGHATAVIGHRLFLFGGRGGPDMAALAEHGRVWVFDTRTHLWSYLDPRRPAAAPLSPVAADTRPPYPAARSYHSAVGVPLPRDFGARRRERPTWAEWAQGDSDLVGTPQNPIVGHVANNSRDEDDDGYGTLVLHGGCLADGRANDTWAFDVRSRVWHELPGAPGAPRGGTTLCLAGGQLWRFGGFDGEGEEGGQLDYLGLTIDSFPDSRLPTDEVVLRAKGEWKSLVAEPLVAERAHVEAAADGPGEGAEPLPQPARAPWPGRRSVAGMQTVTMGGPAGREYLLLLLGERDPSGDGHHAAGSFWDDLWAYELPRATATATATALVDRWLGRPPASAAGAGKWFPVAAAAYDDEDPGAAKGPGARGWFATAHMGELEERGLVLWGGVDAQNSRLGDGWILRLGDEKREV